MLNQLMRYLPIVHLLKKEECRKILEVGGGLRGINAYLPDKFVVNVDINFPISKNMVKKGLYQIKGSAKSLPFKDNSFPVVVCVDTLEHISLEDRESVIKELWRVGRNKIYLSFPVDETYGKWEQKLSRIYKLWKKSIPDWLLEHREKGLPKEESISKFLRENGMAFKIIPNENNFFHFIIMIIEYSRFSKYLNYIVDIISPEGWKKDKHSFKANLTRALFVHLKYFLLFLNFGSTVRKIFVLVKNEYPNRNRKNIAKYYDDHPGSVSSPFGGIGGVLSSENVYLNETLTTLKIDLQNKEILEIGCGGGWFAYYCKDIVNTYVGIDIAITCVKLSKKILPNIIQADAQALPIKSNLFDYIFCIDSFEHIPNQNLAAEEFYRVLKKNGKVFLSIPNYSNVAGMVKKIEESLGFYEKDSWAPFSRWAPQVLEQFMTPNRVKTVFTKSGFKKFTMIGGHCDFLDGIFPWINHKLMPRPSYVRRIFAYVERPLNRLFPWISLHNFWLIEK